MDLCSVMLSIECDIRLMMMGIDIRELSFPEDYQGVFEQLIAIEKGWA